MSVSAYVDLPLAEVVARFSDPGIDGLLTSAIRAALGMTGEEPVIAHADASVWVSSGNVRLSVTWRTRGPDGQANEGRAMVALLVVQSGHEAITELLVTLPVSEESSASITDATHRILDELTRSLERGRADRRAVQQHSAVFEPAARYGCNLSAQVPRTGSTDHR